MEEFKYFNELLGYGMLTVFSIVCLVGLVYLARHVRDKLNEKDSQNALLVQQVIGLTGEIKRVVENNTAAWQAMDKRLATLETAVEELRAVMSGDQGRKWDGMDRRHQNG